MGRSLVGCERVVAAERLTLAPGAQGAHLELRPEPRAARAARQWVRDQVPPLDEDAALALEVLTSELVTNAVLHARTRLTVGVTELVDGVLIAVTDRNMLMPEQQDYSETRTSGRGMTLLSVLARRWGVVTDDEGKIVWFVISPGARDPGPDSARTGGRANDRRRGPGRRGSGRRGARRQPEQAD